MVKSVNARIKDSEMNYSFKRNLSLLIFTAIVGAIIFFVPINGKLPFETIYKTLLLKPLGTNTRFVALGFILFRVVGYIYSKTIAKQDSWMYRFFQKDTIKSFALYLVALAFILMVIFQRGIPFLYSPKTAGMMVEEVFPFTISILPIGGAILPFLTAYGILELVGAILEPIMRPVLKLPGKAAIDTIASIVGAAVVGIFLTTQLYHDKQYTEKEALTITSGFSLNSVGYCAFLVGYVGLGAMFGKMFAIYLVIAYIISMIIVRIPPISKHTNIYKDGTEQTEAMRRESVKLNKDQIIKGFEKGIMKADSSPNLLVAIGKGFIDGVLVLTSLIPMMIVVGGVALAILEFTPLIDIISKPLVPIVSLLGVPEAALAAKAVFIGGIELFVPSIVVTAGTTIEATRYFVVMVTMVQVLYIAETMLPIITFGLPVKLWELFVIWLQRTLIAMPLVALTMHMIF